MIFEIIAICFLVVFYSIYIVKMIIQKKQGIQTDQIARGKDKDRLFYIELLMKIATYGIVLMEVVSIFSNNSLFPDKVRVVGVLLGIFGIIFFAMAVYAMGDSWRAGIAKNDKTKIIKTGIYKISRNPAFLGFDLVYLSILIMFFNISLLILTIFAIVMLHLQILEEEKYLPTVFFEKYLEYKEKVGRYFWKF